MHIKVRSIRNIYQTTHLKVTHLTNNKSVMRTNDEDENDWLLKMSQRHAKNYYEPCKNGSFACTQKQPLTINGLVIKLQKEKEGK